MSRKESRSLKKITKSHLSISNRDILQQKVALFPLKNKKEDTKIMVIPPDGTPYAEAPWLGGIPSPFYKESHRKWQQTCRQFIQEHIGDQTVQWMKDGQLPPDLYTKFAEAGMILPCMPSPRPIKHLQRLGVHGFPGGLKLEEFDYFHYLIYVSEVKELIPKIDVMSPNRCSVGWCCRCTIAVSVVRPAQSSLDSPLGPLPS